MAQKLLDRLGIGVGVKVVLIQDLEDNLACSASAARHVVLELTQKGKTADIAAQPRVERQRPKLNLQKQRLKIIF
jgi:hypothetical protein